METAEVSRMQFFPITLFSTVMGMTGLGIAFDRFDHMTGSHIGVGKYIIYAMLIWFCFLGCRLYVKTYPLSARG